MTHKQKIIAIVGPTASGKTALGVALAREFGGEVISADSRQVYRNMDIIAGVPTLREMRGIPHHLLRIAAPNRVYSAGRFVREGLRAIRQIAKRGRVPIVVGGTGFYTETLLGIMTLPEVPPNKKLRAELTPKSAAELFTQLQKLDPRRAGDIDAQNPARLIRAIEIATALGTVPELLSNPESPFDVLWLGIGGVPPLPARERAGSGLPPLPSRGEGWGEGCRSANISTEDKIRTRILARLRRGMLAEVARLRDTLSRRRFNELGAEFSLVTEHLDGTISRTDLIEKLTQWELKYIKRQLRWHQRNKRIIWISTPTQATQEVRHFLKE